MKKIIALLGLAMILYANYIKKAEYITPVREYGVFGDADFDGNLEFYSGYYFNSDSAYVIVREFDQDFNFTTKYLDYYGVVWDYGDINQNGLPDLMVQSGDPGIGGNGYLRIYEAKYPRAFPDSLIYQFTFPGCKVVYFAQYADLDQDGKKEIITSPNHFTGGGVRIYEYNNGQFDLIFNYIGDNITEKAIGDFNGNGKLELVFSEIHWTGMNLEDYKTLDNQIFSNKTRLLKKDDSFVVRIHIYEVIGDNNFQEIYFYDYSGHLPALIGGNYSLNFDGNSQNNKPKDFVSLISCWDNGYRYLLFNNYKLWYDLGDSANSAGKIVSTIGDFDLDGKDEFVASIQPQLRIYDWTENGVSWQEIENSTTVLGAFNADINHNQYPDILVILFGSSYNRMAIFEYQSLGVGESKLIFSSQIKIFPTIGKKFSITGENYFWLLDSRGRVLKKFKPGIYKFNFHPGIYFIKAKNQRKKIIIIK